MNVPKPQLRKLNLHKNLKVFETKISFVFWTFKWLFHILFKEIMIKMISNQKSLTSNITDIYKTIPRISVRNFIFSNFELRHPGWQMRILITIKSFTNSFGNKKSTCPVSAFVLLILCWTCETLYWRIFVFVFVLLQ